MSYADNTQIDALESAEKSSQLMFENANVNVNAIGSGQAQPPTEEIVIDTKADAKLVRKLDIFIFPLLGCLYLFNSLDKSNIGNARLYGMESDLGMKGQDYQLSVSILFVTYIAFELPGNLLLKRVTPRILIGGAAAAWGLVSMCTGFCHSFAALIVCRLLLGVFEAIFFPCVAFYMTFFYRRRELAIRVFYMFVASAIAGAFGGLIAYGIHFLDGKHGYRAWRYLFIIEGAPTVVLGLLVYLFLPNDTATAYFLNEEDKALCQLRFEADQAELGPTAVAGEVDWDQVRAAFRDWKVYALAFNQIGVTVMLYTYSIFLPTIIAALGYSSYHAQLLTVPCYTCGALVYLICAYTSDRIGKRGIFAVGGCFVSCVGYIIVIACADRSPGSRFAGCLIIAVGLYTCVGIPISWNITNLPSTYKRGTSSGFAFVIGNTAGIWASFTYRTQDAPHYYLGHGIVLACVFLSGVGFAIISLKLHNENKLRDRGGRDYRLENKTPQQIARLGDLHPSYRYVC